jgi:hypothetical protein
LSQAELTGPGIKKISFQFMRQYEADVVYLEEFLQEFSNLKYEEIFDELMQVSLARDCPEKRYTDGL